MHKLHQLAAGKRRPVHHATPANQSQNQKNETFYFHCYFSNARNKKERKKKKKRGAGNNNFFL